MLNVYPVELRERCVFGVEYNDYNSSTMSLSDSLVNTRVDQRDQFVSI